MNSRQVDPGHAYISEPDLPILVDERAREESKDYISKSRRKRREQNTMHWGFVVLLCIAVMGVAFVLIARISHLLLPAKYYWLTEEQITKLNEFLTTGIIGGTIVALFKSKVLKSNEEQ
ncbi:MAG: hypothetical protein WCF67_03930 [Chitinophagaceae bacterium]